MSKALFSTSQNFIPHHPVSQFSAATRWSWPTIHFGHRHLRPAFNSLFSLWIILCKLLQHVTSCRNSLYRAHPQHPSCLRINTPEVVQDPSGTALRADEAANSDNQWCLLEKKALWGTSEAQLMTQNPDDPVLRCTWRTQPAAVMTLHSWENQWGLTGAQQSKQVRSK